MSVFIVASFIAGVLLITGGIILLLGLAEQYITWHPSARLTHTMSKYVNLPRQKGERLLLWDRRVNAALDELRDAEDEFLSFAYKEGYYTQEGPRCLVWHLPPDHPASIRVAKAKGLIV